MLSFMKELLSKYVYLIAVKDATGSQINVFTKLANKQVWF